MATPGSACSLEPSSRPTRGQQGRELFERRGRDSNPRYLVGTHALQACPFGHSGTSPRKATVAKVGRARKRTARGRATAPAKLLSRAFLTCPSADALLPESRVFSLRHLGSGESVEH